MKNWLIPLKKHKPGEERPSCSHDNEIPPSRPTSTQVGLDSAVVTKPSCSNKSDLEPTSCTAVVSDIYFANEDDPDDASEISPETPIHTIPGSSQENPNLSLGSKTKAKTKQKIYKFNTAWQKLSIFSGWLQKHEKKRGGSDVAYCSVCNVILSAHKTELIRHSKSVKHVALSKEIATNKNIKEIVQDTTLDATKRAELKLAAFIASSNLPFSVMDTLVPLLKDIIPDSKIMEKMNMKKDKTTKTIKNALGNTFLELLYTKLRTPGCFFSLIMDETTDKSSIKQCALTVTYLDPGTGSIKTSFFDMYEVETSNAEELYKKMMNSLTSKNIPLENLVGFSSDTTNVMVGQYKSVFALLKKDFPNIVCIRCSCHLIHLAASKACLMLPKGVEDLLRNLGAHFGRSYGRQSTLKEFQEFFKVEIHKILLPSITRWLSLKQCVDRVLEQYEALKAYLTVAVLEDPSHTTESMLSSMKNDFVHIYLEFMSYVLGILVDFNVLFQSETPLLHRLKPEVEKMLKDLCLNFLKPDYVRNTSVWNIAHSNPTHFIELGKLYLGIAAQESLEKLRNKEDLKETEMDTFYRSCMNFYVELVTQIKTRFDFTDPIFDILKIVDPKFAQSFSIRTLSSLLQRFPNLKELVSPQDLDQEWKRHILLDFDEEGLDSSRPALEYWQKVFLLKTSNNELAFPNLKIVFNLLFVLPFSNAAVERVFSTLNDTKTSERNRLKTDTIVGVLATRQGVIDSGGCVKFEPTKNMLNKNVWH